MHKQNQIAFGSRPVELNSDCLMEILRRCDEPTRDCAMLASRQMHVLTTVARQLDYTQAARRPGRWTQEALPTATELADRGCPKPNWPHAAKAMQVSPVGVGDDARPLLQFYLATIAAADAQAAGTGFTMLVDSNGRTLGGAALPQGFGLCKGPDGITCEGMWKDGVPHGHAIESDTGARYEGAWSHGIQNGYGVYTRPDGLRHEGFWEAGRQEGLGMHTWPSGTRYEGGWKDGKQDGMGVCSYDTGLTYEGAWKAGYPHGYGVATWPDGRRYEGEYKFGQKNGHGVCTWPDGRRYEGAWRAGRQDGESV